jgi:hypothetical protein
MSTKLTRKNAPIPRGLYRRNWIAFPRELRAAIPDLHGGRVLEIDAVTAQSANAALFGPLVELKLVVSETGKLSGKFVLVMGLQADAARQLSATLAQLADQADPKPAG